MQQLNLLNESSSYAALLSFVTDGVRGERVAFVHAGLLRVWKDCMKVYTENIRRDDSVHASQSDVRIDILTGASPPWNEPPSPKSAQKIMENINVILRKLSEHEYGRLIILMKYYIQGRQDGNKGGRAKMELDTLFSALEAASGSR